MTSPAVMSWWPGPNVAADGTYGHASFVIDTGNPNDYLEWINMFLTGVNTTSQYGTITLAIDDPSPGSCIPLNEIVGTEYSKYKNYIGAPPSIVQGKPLAPEYARFGGGNYGVVVIIGFQITPE